MYTGSSGPYRHNPQSSHATWNPAPPRPPSDHPTAAATNANNTNASNHVQQQAQPRTNTAASSADGLPEPPKTFPELEAMPLRDLRVLQDERAKFHDFVSKHQHQMVVDEFVSRIRASVEKFEREHEAVTEKIGEVVDEDQLAELRSKIKDLEEEVKGLQVLKDEWLEHNSPERLIERLRIAVRESETVSEGLEKSMLSSSMNFGEFLEQYIACRKKYHERCIKLEELKKHAKIRSLAR